MPPNVTPDAPLLRAVKLLVELLSPSERGALRPWLLARFDVAGRPSRRLPGDGD